MDGYDLSVTMSYRDAGHAPEWRIGANHIAGDTRFLWENFQRQWYETVPKDATGKPLGNSDARYE